MQGRLPQEFRLTGITDMEITNRFLKEVFLPDYNVRTPVQYSIIKAVS